MIDIVEVLLEESVSDCVAYTEFMLNYNKNEDKLYCFFEGNEDRFYYSVRIDLLASTGNNNSFICGGKEKVLKVYQLIKANNYYKNVKTSFYIDSDFDENEINPDIYITPTYSIENLYCTKESFEKILISEFKMNPKENDFIKCVENYISIQERFNEETLLLNAWLACQSDFRYENKNNTYLKIDKNVKTYFDKIVLTDLSSIKELDGIKTKIDIENIFVDSPKIENDKLETKMAYFNTLDKSNKFRGKFILKLLENYLCRLQSISGVNPHMFEKKYSSNLRYEYATICSSLSQYATTPDCLKNYISKF
ncbi:DUF4435 domain-containing protein [Flavobacterium frigoris]|uniref:DUF4435 domain-containing protein n=1 Tax=Flavobacterium frigoris TaxID=229204 RepID=A0A1H9RYT4_FLAFI|nr:DUF4435 domain-containing protein [Flavobacterium frigoris]SER77029.1 Protein of unknown function [Flavobacterium frigoris]